jgi:DHA1 family bicyclomycin/chloramphenicol resistance-like MFS transporter
LQNATFRIAVTHDKSSLLELLHMLTPGSFGLTLLLSLLTGIGPLSMDMYLPSLPEIGRALHAPTATVQLTISSYLFGFAAGQIFYGPISDRLGRRPVLLVALVLYAIGSIICSTTQSIEMLIVARFVQALGAAPARSCGRAPWCGTSTAACVRDANCR